MIEYLKKTRAEPRGSDAWGAGHFGAPRGDRYHAGADYLIPAGSMVLSPVSGRVIRIGIAYSRDPSFKILEIEALDGLVWRLFYVWPFVDVGDRVFPGVLCAKMQDLSALYSDDDRGPIPNHIHVEVIRDGKKIDPETVVRETDG